MFSTPGMGGGDTLQSRAEAHSTIYGRDSNAAGLPQWAIWTGLGALGLVLFIVLLKTLKD